MKKGITILSVAIVIGIVVTVAVGAHRCGREGTVPADATLASGQAYGVAAVNPYPYWRVEAIWRQSWKAWPGEDHVGPIAYEFHYPVEPTRQVVDSFMSAPLGGNWKVVRLTSVKKIRSGQNMDEIPTRPEEQK